MKKKPAKPASPLFFPIFFGCIIVFFCGVLVFSYIESKRANPIMLDEQGQIREATR